MKLSAQDLTGPAQVTMLPDYDVELSGCGGTVQFINGLYHIQKGILHGDRPTYKHESNVPPGFSTLSGRSVFLYFHPTNTTWTIAMDVGSLEVIAFGVGDVVSPNHVVGQWYTSEESEYKLNPKVQVRRARAGS